MILFKLHCTPPNYPEISRKLGISIEHRFDSVGKFKKFLDDAKPLIDQNVLGYGTSEFGMLAIDPACARIHKYLYDGKLLVRLSYYFHKHVGHNAEVFCCGHVKTGTILVGVTAPQGKNTNVYAMFKTYIAEDTYGALRNKYKHKSGALKDL